MKLPEYRQISSRNLPYTYMELDFTHDYSKAKIGSIFVNRNGESRVVTAIITESGRKEYWSNYECLAIQYTPPHNMLTKSPFWAYRWKLKNDFGGHLL
jgi:hypothetical protein